MCTLLCYPQHHHHDLLSVKPEDSSLPSRSAQDSFRAASSFQPPAGAVAHSLQPYIIKEQMSDTITAWATCQLAACLRHVPIAVTKCHRQGILEKEGFVWTHSPRGMRVHQYYGRDPGSRQEWQQRLLRTHMLNVRQEAESKNL